MIEDSTHHIRKTTGYIEQIRQYVGQLRTLRRDDAGEYARHLKTKSLDDSSRVLQRLATIFGYKVTPLPDFTDLNRRGSVREHLLPEVLFGMLGLRYIDGSWVNPLSVLRNNEDIHKRNERLSLFLLRLLEVSSAIEYMRNGPEGKEDSWSISWRLLQELPVYTTQVRGDIPARHSDVLKEMGAGFHTINVILKPSTSEVGLHVFHQVNGMQADRIGQGIKTVPEPVSLDVSYYATVLHHVYRQTIQPVTSGTKEADSSVVQITAIDLSNPNLVAEAEPVNSNFVALSLCGVEVGYDIGNKSDTQIEADLSVLYDYLRSLSPEDRLFKLNPRGALLDRNIAALVHRRCLAEKTKPHLAPFFLASSRIVINDAPALSKKAHNTASLEDVVRAGFCFPFSEIDDVSGKKIDHLKRVAYRKESRESEVQNAEYDAAVLSQTAESIRTFLLSGGAIPDHLNKIVSTASLFSALWYTVRGPVPLMNTIMTDIFPQKLTGSAVLASAHPLVRRAHDLYTEALHGGADSCRSQLRDMFVELLCVMAEDMAQGKAEIDAPSSGVRLTRALGSEVASFPPLVRKLLKYILVHFGRLPLYRGGELFIEGMKQIDMDGDPEVIYQHLLSLIYAASGGIDFEIEGRKTTLQEELFATANFSCTPTTEPATTCVAINGMRFRLCADDRLVVTGNLDCQKAAYSILQGAGYIRGLFLNI